MITKGIIKSIDLLGNTCTVHLPFFETAGNDPIIETATVSNTPGSYNGYKVGDVVYVAFEDGNMDTPVVIGKLYLGTEKEKADPRGVSNVEESTTTKKATLPADAKLAAEIDSSVPNTTVPYGSLSSIANGLNTLNTNVGQMDRDYGNRFKQVISDADGLKSELEQTAKNMVAKVSGYKQAVDANGNKIYDENGQPKWELDDKGERIPTAFGWDLQAESWRVFNEDKTILKADKYGLHVSGQIDAEKGHIGKFIIGADHECHDSEGKSTRASGIYSEGYIDKYEKEPTTQGVYVGTDGIKLGKNFSVDTAGNLYAKNLTIAEDAEITGTINSANINVAGLNADGIKVVKKDENGNPIIVDGKKVIVFNADATVGTVKIGGFTVTDNSLSAGSGTSAVVLSTDAILLGGTTTSTAPFSVDHDGSVLATRGEVGGWSLTSKKFTKKYKGDKESNETVELSPEGINFTNTGGNFSTLPSGVYKTNHYAGIDTTSGLGVYGDKITRIFQTSSTASSWQNAFRASVPGIIPNKTNWNSTDNITLLIYDKVTIPMDKDSTTWKPEVLTGNITSIASVFVSGGDGTTGLSVSAYVSKNTTNGDKVVTIETSAPVAAMFGATVYLLALCAVNPSPRV